jgi:hypothetical protein
MDLSAGFIPLHGALAARAGRDFRTTTSTTDRGAVRPGSTTRSPLLCHRQEDEHGELARVRGVAPLDLTWRLGRKELASWYRNERRLRTSRSNSASSPRLGR